MSEVNARLRIKQDTLSNFITNNPTLLTGEFGFNVTNKKIKIGDGITPWNSLKYIDQKSRTVTVSQQNGDFSTINAAINSITDASDINNYVVLVYPGEYSENIEMKDYIDIIGHGRNTVINGSVTFGTFVTSQSVLRNLVIYSIENPSLIINCNGDVYIQSAYCASIWSTNVSIQSVIRLQKGNVLINSTSELIMRQMSTNTGVQMSCIYHISTTNQVSLKSFDTIHSLYCLDAQNDLSLLYSTNTNTSTYARIKNGNLSIEAQHPSALNNIPIIYHYTCSTNTIVEHLNTFIIGNAGNIIIPGLVSNSTISSDVTIIDSLISFQNIPNANVYIGSSTHSTDTLRLVDCIFSMYDEDMPVRYILLGEAGNLYYKITNLSLYEMRTGVLNAEGVSFTGMEISNAVIYDLVDVVINHGLVTTSPYTIDMREGGVHDIIVGANLTFNFIPFDLDRTRTIIVKLTNGGSYTIVWNNIAWARSSQITNLTKNGTDLISIVRYSDSSTYGSVIGLDYK